jgi:hypothetical protein
LAYSVATMSRSEPGKTTCPSRTRSGRARRRGRGGR